VQLACDGAGGRVEHRLDARVGMDDMFAADEMTDGRGRVEGGGGHGVSPATVAASAASLGLRRAPEKAAGLDSLFV